MEERTNYWLKNKMDTIWTQYFPDVRSTNYISIAYKYAWKKRLGMIRMTTDGVVTEIDINRLLKSPKVPEQLTTITIAHELIHYSHGFGSPLPRLYDDPHKDDIITKELVKRGLALELAQYDQWIDEHWWPFYYAWKEGISYEENSVLQMRQVSLPSVA